MLVNIYKLSNDLNDKILYVYQNTNENDNLIKYNCYINVMIYKTLKYYLDYKNCMTKQYISTILINKNGEIYTDDGIFIDPNTYFSLL